MISDSSGKENGLRHTGDIVINSAEEEVKVEIADPSHLSKVWI